METWLEDGQNKVEDGTIARLFLSAFAAAFRPRSRNRVIPGCISVAQAESLVSSKTVASIYMTTRKTNLPPAPH